MPAFPDPETRNALADECRRCPGLVEAREHISWGNGPLDSDLAGVGAPAGSGPEQ
jgi:DNA polymerase